MARHYGCGRSNMFHSLFKRTVQGNVVVVVVVVVSLICIGRSVLLSLLTPKECAICFYVLQVVTSKIGMLYGIIGMCTLIAAFWADATYTYDEGIWLIAASMAPGAVCGLW
jgi:hypothetical protein